jgi:hypothetical protein
MKGLFRRHDWRRASYLALHSASWHTPAERWLRVERESGLKVFILDDAQPSLLITECPNSPSNSKGDFSGSTEVARVFEKQAHLYKRPSGKRGYGKRMIKADYTESNQNPILEDKGGPDANENRRGGERTLSKKPPHFRVN